MLFDGTLVREAFMFFRVVVLCNDDQILVDYLALVLML